MAKPLALTFCVQCGNAEAPKGRNGKQAPNPSNQALALAVKEVLETHHPKALETLAVRLSRCQGACKTPCSWQLAGANREALQWGGGCLELAPAIAETAAAYALLQPHQKLTKALYPGILRGKMLARILPWPKPKGYR